VHVCVVSFGLPSPASWALPCAGLPENFLLGDIAHVSRRSLDSLLSTSLDDVLTHSVRPFPVLMMTRRLLSQGYTREELDEAERECRTVRNQRYGGRLKARKLSGPKGKKIDGCDGSISKKKTKSKVLVIPTKGMHDNSRRDDDGAGEPKPQRRRRSLLGGFGNSEQGCTSVNRSDDAAPTPGVRRLSTKQVQPKRGSIRLLLDKLYGSNDFSLSEEGEDDDDAGEEQLVSNAMGRASLVFSNGSSRFDAQPPSPPGRRRSSASSALILRAPRRRDSSANIANRCRNAPPQPGRRRSSRAMPLESSMISHICDVDDEANTEGKFCKKAESPTPDRHLSDAAPKPPSRPRSSILKRSSFQCAVIGDAATATASLQSPRSSILKRSSFSFAVAEDATTVAASLQAPQRFRRSSWLFRKVTSAFSSPDDEKMESLVFRVEGTVAKEPAQSSTTVEQSGQNFAKEDSLASILTESTGSTVDAETEAASATSHRRRSWIFTTKAVNDSQTTAVGRGSCTSPSEPVHRRRSWVFGAIPMPASPRSVRTDTGASRSRRSSWVRVIGKDSRDAESADKKSASQAPERQLSISTRPTRSVHFPETDLERTIVFNDGLANAATMPVTEIPSVANTCTVHHDPKIMSALHSADGPSLLGMMTPYHIPRRILARSLPYGSSKRPAKHGKPRRVSDPHSLPSLFDAANRVSEVELFGEESLSALFVRPTEGYQTEELLPTIVASPTTYGRALSAQ